MALSIFILKISRWKLKSWSANSIQPGQTAQMWRLAWLYTGGKDLSLSVPAGYGLMTKYYLPRNVLFGYNSFADKSLDSRGSGTFMYMQNRDGRWMLLNAGREWCMLFTIDWKKINKVWLETLHSLLNTGWIQKRICWECVYKLKSFLHKWAKINSV